MSELPDKLEITDDQELVVLLSMSRREDPLQLPWGAQRVFIRQPWAIEAVLKMREREPPWR